ncbi:hypothetical protein MRB53_023270 [Persea americana]|uniref:Uncharacterized protein n=1 Tax=Persea americana TaxID=3435 RepID=A0ACC2L9C1_PERAE|nr:hypothetical protein MRB53_023270 [Persea americana]
MEPPAKIIVKDEESGGTPEFAKQASETYESFAIPQDVPTLIPGEEIAYLEPGQTTKQNLQFCFHQQLTVFCNGKKLPISDGLTTYRHHPLICIKLAFVLVVPDIENQNIEYVEIALQESRRTIQVRCTISSKVTDV